MTATDWLPGEIVRLRVRSPFILGSRDECSFEFVMFLGTFDGHAVVQNANGGKRLCEFDDITRVPFTTTSGEAKP